MFQACEDMDGEKDNDPNGKVLSVSTFASESTQHVNNLEKKLQNLSSPEKNNKSGDKKTDNKCNLLKSNIGSYNSKINNIIETSVSSNNSFNDVEQDGIASDVCFGSLDITKELNCVTVDIPNNSRTTYLVCNLCQSLFKSTAEIDSHTCQNQTDCLQSNGSSSYKSLVSINENQKNSEKEDKMVEITIIEELMERDSDEVITERDTNDLSKGMKSKLRCFICNLDMSNRSELAVHILSHYPVQKSTKKGTVCPVCQATFTSLNDFMNHYDTHVSSDRNKLKTKESAILNKVVCSANDKKVSQDSITTTYSCPICKLSNSSSAELNGHLRVQHNVNTCHICYKEFPSDLKLKEHLVIHEAKIKPNQCEFCLICFNSSKELEVHTESAHDQIKTTKACPLCRKRCGSSFSVKRHIIKNHLIPVLQQEIREKYSHGSDLVDDMKSLGASDKFIKSITDINKSSLIENNLKQYKLIVNIEASDVNFCLLCGFSSKSLINLDKHRKKHSIKKIPCPLMCEYLSCDADELISHLSNSHDTILSEDCCPHCLNEPDENITLHMKALHSKFYTHLSCYVCKEMFFNKENLKYHFSMTHLISEHQFEDKGDDVEPDENSVEVDDPLENCSRESVDENMMNNELSAALESITHDSTIRSLSPVDENLTVPFEQCSQSENDALDNICVICRKECGSAKDLSLHLSKHSEEPENLDCPFCSETLHDKEHLHIHVVKEHPLSTQNYCFCCEKSFSSRNTFVKHLNTKCLNRNCAVCNKQFVTIAAFIQHMAYGHRKDFTCQHCKKLCKSLKHLKYHEKVHVKYKGKLFKCNTCGKTFQTPNSLKSHSICHTGNYPYVCEFCGRGFLSSYRLSEHRASHTNDIRYCCEICGKSFRLYDTYHRHRRQHDNPFPAQCNECGKRFRNSSRVSEHKRKVHTGERPYACPHCPMTFNVTSSYRIHLCRHTNVYPYNCDLCKRGFGSRFKYGNHRAAKHNDFSFVNSRSENSHLSSN